MTALRVVLLIRCVVFLVRVGAVPPDILSLLWKTLSSIIHFICQEYSCCVFIGTSTCTVQYIVIHVRYVHVWLYLGYICLSTIKFPVSNSPNLHQCNKYIWIFVYLHRLDFCSRLLVVIRASQHFFLHSLWCPFPPNRRRSTISKTKAPLSQATTAVSRCVTDEAHSGHLNIFHLDSRRRRESLSGLNVSCCY